MFLASNIRHSESPTRGKTKWSQVACLHNGSFWTSSGDLVQEDLTCLKKTSILGDSSQNLGDHSLVGLQTKIQSTHAHCCCPWAPAPPSRQKPRSTGTGTDVQVGHYGIQKSKQASSGKPESQIVVQLQQPILGLLKEGKEKKKPHKHNIMLLQEQVCWYMPVIPALRRLRQENCHEFKLAWMTKWANGMPSCFTVQCFRLIYTKRKVFFGCSKTTPS